ncbi:HEAT repeat domain-containing protein [Falsibacillus pallidus]|uniref:HEAT repeat domain-containing protein n=1 Tax=Falsibacillus pallidus TaxID=493781 RepID=UPI003D985857
MLTKEILFLGIVSSTIFVLLIILLSYLIIRKTSEIQSRKKIDRLKETFHPFLLEYVMEGKKTRKLIVDSPRKMIAMEELLENYGELLKDDAAENKISSLAEKHLSSFYLKGLRSRKWSSRMNALYHIELFQLNGMSEHVCYSICRKNASKEEIVEGLKILAQFSHPSLFELIQYKFTDLKDMDYRKILVYLSDENLDPIILSYHILKPELQWALLDILGQKKEFKYLPLIESIYRNYKGEVRLRAAKAIASIGYIRSYEMYLPLASSQIWQERLMAAKIFGRANETSLLPYLENLLSDHSWYVRSEAGHALSIINGGEKVLQNAIINSTDPFARDMAREWMNKGVL